MSNLPQGLPSTGVQLLSLLDLWPADPSTSWVQIPVLEGYHRAATGAGSVGQHVEHSAYC